MFSFKNRGNLQAGERRSQTPDGTPAVTGYYPNIYRGSNTPGKKPDSPIYENHYATSNIGPDWEQFDKTIWTQKMPVQRYSSTIVPDSHVERNSGVFDPLSAGPVAPTIRMISRSLRRQGGTSNTRNLDNTVTDKSPYGVKDGVTWVATIDPVLANYKLSPPTQESSVVLIPPSGVRGLHTQIPKKYRNQSNISRAMRPQQKPARVDRLASSQYVGQTYSATTTHIAPNVKQENSRGRRGLR